MKHTTRAVSATSFFSPASGDYTIVVSGYVVAENTWTDREFKGYTSEPTKRDLNAAIAAFKRRYREVAA